MAKITIIKEVKKIHPHEIVIVKMGKFYHVYGKDSYIISYLFKYKLQRIEQNIVMSGFPENVLNKIRATLENKKINYLILNRRLNYEVEEFSNNKNKNKYKEIYIKAHDYINLKKRVENINTYLMGNLANPHIKKKIFEIESLLKK